MTGRREAVVYMVLGDAQEALMLLGFVFVVMGISFFQQRRSGRIATGKWA